MRSVRLLQPAGFVSLREEAEVGVGREPRRRLPRRGRQGSRIDAQLTMAGEGAFVEYGGALLTAADQRQECAVRANHACPNGASHQLWRAVAADRSQASLAAAVEVARHAQKTDGEVCCAGCCCIAPRR
ncbi:SufD family Fe-S cluster assembly protein [Sphingomonas sp. MMS24-JH45]